MHLHVKFQLFHGSIDDALALYGIDKLKLTLRTFFDNVRLFLFLFNLVFFPSLHNLCRFFAQNKLVHREQADDR